MSDTFPASRSDAPQDARPAWARVDGADLLLRIKAVPGASRDAIAGPLGDRLKVRVAAPPEGGKANAAIVALLSRTLGVPKRDVSIETGASAPEKLVRVHAGASWGADGNWEAALRRLS